MKPPVRVPARDTATPCSVCLSPHGCYIRGKSRFCRACVPDDFWACKRRNEGVAA